MSVVGLKPAAYTTPVTTAFVFEAAELAGLDWWAPWDLRSYSGGGWHDPLSPSPLGGGATARRFNYGIVYKSAHAHKAAAADMVVAPLVAVLNAKGKGGGGGAGGRGWSLHLDPGQPSAAWAELALDGTGTGFEWNHAMLRLSPATPQTITMDIVGHAPCWRPALAFHVSTYAPPAAQLYPHGGQFDFVWLCVRTPHGAYA